MFKNLMILILVAALATILPACGSGGGNNTSSGATTDNRSVYTGEILYNINTVSDQYTDRAKITIEITPESVVNIHFGPGFFGSARMTGSSFTVWGSIPGVHHGPFSGECPLGDVSKITGTIADNTINGNLSGKGACNNAGGVFSLSTTGKYSAILTSGDGAR